MWFLYLDESGDLGFDFFGKKPSKYFTVTVLVVNGIENNKRMAKAVKRTIKKKLIRQKRKELKGSKDSIDIKQFFFKQIRPIPFEVYSLTLNKRRVYDHLTQKKNRVYNFIARKVLDIIPLENAIARITLIIDKSKNRREIREFNDYLIRQLSGKIDPKIPLDIEHRVSHEYSQLQAVDLFSWGIFRKHEKNDSEWFDVFKDKVRYDDVYLP